MPWVLVTAAPGGGASQAVEQSQVVRHSSAHQRGRAVPVVRRELRRERRRAQDFSGRPLGHGGDHPVRGRRERRHANGDASVC